VVHQLALPLHHPELLTRDPLLHRGIRHHIALLQRERIHNALQRIDRRIRFAHPTAHPEQVTGAVLATLNCEVRHQHPEHGLRRQYQWTALARWIGFSALLTCHAHFRRTAPHSTPRDRNAQHAIAPTPTASQPVHAAAGILGRVTQRFLDPQQLIVLRNAIRAAGGTGLDLTSTGANRKIRDEGVFRFAAAM
jgi:hypothetical protein